MKAIFQKLVLFAKKPKDFLRRLFSFFKKFFSPQRPLKKYIKNLLNQGYLKRQVIENLMSAGFKKEDIQNIFLEIEGVAETEDTKRKESSMYEEKQHLYVAAPAREDEKGDMGWLDLFYLASRSFRNRASRTLLTSLGVSVGFGAILVLISLGYGLENILIRQLVSSDALLSLSVVPSESIKLDSEKIDEISRFEGVIEISPLAAFSSELAFSDITSNTFIYAVFPSYFRLSTIKPKAGDILKDSDPYSVVVSSALMESLVIKNYEDILNKEVRLTLFVQKEEGEEAGTIELMPLEKSFKIVGVIDDPTTSYLYLNLSFIKDIKNISYKEAKVKVSKSDYIAPVQEKIINAGFLSSSLSATVKQANKIFKGVQAVLAVFGAVALVVSAIGMINTMTITLLERINEIGIMKAIGATNRDIKKLFLTEALLIAGAGGLGGVIIGMLTQSLLNLGFNILAKSLGGKAIDLFYQPPWFIATLIVFPILIGFFTGFWPAKKASRIDPLRALRYK